MSVLSSLLCALAVASPLIGASNQSLPLSAWVDGCATRTHAIGDVHVTGFHLRAVLTEAQIAPLVEFEAIDSLSRETASSLIGTFTAAAPYREAFRYELWSSDGHVVVRRARDAELDTFVAWLEAVPPSDRLAQAIGAVLNAWGSSDPLFDLNGDGTVDGLDIERAAEELPIP